ncbi:hypothetical protein [Methylocystis sp. SC2]|uniref:hypothetical protein n=1 Tax=Methylocystis sp. (strain SC2) TaxID=187303 RepID=UPI00027AF008|nr:hypothetical protein [Methylocystis sp. SC2]CCJ07048.1 Hypothetical protein BN69_1597 [Methylocystis sp. SC2]
MSSVTQTARISPAAHATLTRPLIHADGRFNRGAITRKARSEFRAGRARTWSAAMFAAWKLAHRQLDAARDYDAARRAFISAPNLRRSARRPSWIGELSV